MSRKIILIASTLILLSGCKAGWQTLSTGGFKVDMPGKPQEKTQSVNTPAGNTVINGYTVETEGEGFAVSYNDYPAEAMVSAKPEEVLNGAREGAMRNVGGQVASERSITLNGKPGKEIIGDSTRMKKGTFVYRLYWDNPRLYQVVYIRPKGTNASANGEKFLNSFQLTGK